MNAPVLVVFCLTLVTVAAACDERPTVSSTRDERPTGIPECFDRDRGREREVRLEGDVDGDGEDEVVSVLVDPSGAPGCAAVLAAVGKREYGAPVEVLDETVFELGLPAPYTLVELDGAPGLEVVVNVHAGASTQFAAVYTVRDERLVRMRIEDAPQDLLAFGGSVAHLEGVDCDRGGVVAAAAVPRGRRYRVSRTFYRVEGAALRVERRERSVVDSRELARVPEFGPPFASCL